MRAATLEVRWFFREPPCPRGLWFDDSHASPPRTDWYAFPCDARCGVKVREGRLEIKMRLEDLGVQSVGPAQGRMERWTKSLAPFAEDEVPLEKNLAEAGWKAVTKQRWLRTFTLKDAALQEVPPNPRPTPACQFEWSELEIASGRWWTINLETYGDRETQQRLLDVAAGDLLTRLPSASLLSADHSCGYPEWLGRMF